MSVITPYKPLPISFVRGEGVWLYDDEGKRYLDALAGIAVCGLGHAHPAITQAITQQAQQLLHTSNLYQIPRQIELGEKLTRLTGLEKIFFANSGAEANEAAIKLARLYGHQQNIDNPTIIVMEKAFHGRTMATLTASGNRKIQAGFEPLVSGFIRAPFNDIETLTAIAQNTEEVVAVFLEPIQGEGGVNIPDPDYLLKVRELCDQNNWLMILDEIQTGMGRTGRLYAFQHHDLLPDIITTAKGLGNGFPIGACIIGKKAAELFQPGKHGSTFGGNPLACTVGLAVLQTLYDNDLFTQVQQMGDYFLTSLHQALDEKPEVGDIRGYGLMLGVELKSPCRDLLKIGLKHGILFGVTSEKVIRILPPLIISKEQIDEFVEKLALCIDEFSEAVA